jgi:hypothetical protein
MEASKASSSANLTLRTFLYNFSTDQYVALPTVMILTTSDDRQTFNLPGGASPADFVETGTNQVRLLLHTIQSFGPPNVRAQIDEILFNVD